MKRVEVILRCSDGREFRSWQREEAYRHQANLNAGEVARSALAKFKQTFGRELAPPTDQHKEAGHA